MGKGVCRTANYIAAARAKETERGEKAIACDPWAKEFAGEEGFQMLDHFAPYRLSSLFASQPQPEDLTVMTAAIRTRFFDDHLLQSLQADEQLRQVVLLGCGFDTRSCRLSAPEGTVFYEVDLPDIIQRRDQVLGTHEEPQVGGEASW